MSAAGSGNGKLALKSRLKELLRPSERLAGCPEALEKMQKVPNDASQLQEEPIFMP